MPKIHTALTINLHNVDYVLKKIAASLFGMLLAIKALL